MQYAIRLREKLQNGKLIVGAHTFFTDPAITEALGYQGFEFVWIDGEHSAFDKASTLNHIIAAHSAGTASIVRIAWNDPVLAKPILEMGPDAILFPMVCTAEEAKQAVNACTYPPEGIRGFGPRRANQYGAISNGEYLKNAKDSFLRIVQIEHVDAVHNLEEILNVDGIDLVLVGPNDLSASIGHIGNTNNPDSIALYEEVITKCKKAKKPFGVSVGAGDAWAIEYWITNGVGLIGCGDDISYICMGSKQTLDFVQTLKER